MKCGIYVITCSGNGIVYVGQSKDIDGRWLEHKRLCQAPEPRTNRRLFWSAKKYGINSLSIEVIEECDISKLTEREQFWLDAYRIRVGRRVANCAGPVDNPTRGVPKSESHRLRLSIAKTGVKVPALCGDSNPSRRHAFRQRMRGALNPSKRPDVRKLIGERNAKAVRDVETGDVWRSMSACASSLGVSVAAVHAAATKKNQTVKGRVLERVA